MKISCERTNKRGQADPVQIFDVKKCQGDSPFYANTDFFQVKIPF